MKQALLIPILLVSLLGGCESPSANLPSKDSGSAAPGQTYSVGLLDRTFQVELANTFQSRQRGLSNRSHLEPEAGMLFVMPVPQNMAMWMKDCLTPLDVLFFDADRRLINYHTMAIPTPGVPEDSLPRYLSDKPAKYALEVGAGTATRLGLKPGDELILSQELLKTLAYWTE